MPHPGHSKAFRRVPDHNRATFGSGAPVLLRKPPLIQSQALSQTLSHARTNLRPVVMTGVVLSLGLLASRLCDPQLRA